VSDFGKFSLPAKSEALISIALRTQFVKHKSNYKCLEGTVTDPKVYSSAPQNVVHMRHHRQQLTKTLRNQGSADQMDMQERRRDGAAEKLTG
jgi:hypothetical protein